MKKFNKSKYNVNRLNPLSSDIELNKCTHEVIDKEAHACRDCGAHITTTGDEFAIDHNTISNLINALEYSKMVIYNTDSTIAERKAAQKYFDMIPLLKNIDRLFEVCNDKLEGYSFMEEDVENNYHLDYIVDNDEPYTEEVEEVEFLNE